MNAQEILLAAAEAIGDRAALRDTESERSMARCVAAFNSLTDARLTEVDGWLFAAILKLARARGGAHHLDDYLDCSAYVALAGEAAEGDNHDH
jgi:hypothetical protein